MDDGTKSKLLNAIYPRKAVWRMAAGNLETDGRGMILAATPDSFEVRTEQGDTYTQATADVLTLLLL
jgi:hypothetical protein